MSLDLKRWVGQSQISPPLLRLSAMDAVGILPMQVPETNPVDPPRSCLRYLESSSDSLGSAPEFTRMLAKMDARLAVFRSRSMVWDVESVNYVM